MRVRYAWLAWLFLPAVLGQSHAARGEPPPKDVIETLRQGNQDYVDGRIDTAALTGARRAGAVKGERPFAAVVSCADSRVIPEAIFGQGIGDLFVIRVGGPVANPEVLGSLEYAAEHLGTNVIVILGHTSCGIVKAALDLKTPPAHPKPANLNLESLLKYLRPAMARPQTHGDPWTSAVYATVDQTVQDVLAGSPMLRRMQSDGQLTLVGAVYELPSGRVVFSKPVPSKRPVTRRRSSRNDSAP
jgi:carbonic anhydrase